MQRINRDQARKHSFGWRDEPLIRVRPGELPGALSVPTPDRWLG